jgi:rhomboid family GlyGly-CTERM serine protease
MANRWIASVVLADRNRNEKRLDLFELVGREIENTMKRFPWVTVALAFAALGMYRLPEATALFEYSRTGIGRCEVWRLVTAHFTHFGLDHLRWDLAVFCAFGTLAEFNNRRSFLITLGAASIAITVAVAVFQPEIENYRGLSGLDSALFGLVMIGELLEGWAERRFLACGLCGLACLGFGAKTLYELMAGRTVFVENSLFSPIPLAHLVGFLVAGTVSLSSRKGKLIPRTLFVA